MLRYQIIVLCCCLIQIWANEESPRIIIIGSGPSGVAAGTRLLENGFTNITILEAENRIGGRVHTTQFAGYPVDLGGQWVVGEENNAAFDLAWPLGLLEKSGSYHPPEMFSSAGLKIPQETANGLDTFFISISNMEVPEEYNNQTIGDWYTLKLDEYFNDHPDITNEQREPLKNMFCLMIMGLEPADSWFNVALVNEYVGSSGDQYINWKDRCYGTIIDILLKKFPNPNEELPFVNKTVLNAEVSQINYNNTEEPVRVVTENGDEYFADHVIVTTSLGVLKSDHEKLFNPPLPEVKVNAIKNIGFGSIAKIYLFYPEPWWPNPNELYPIAFYWTDEDKSVFANDPEKSWLLGLYLVIAVEHKPGILSCWLAAEHVRKMESLPEESVLSGVKEILHRFLDKTYNLTEPTEMLRTQWFTNKHFRGTYSYWNAETRSSGAVAAHLEEPIMEHDKPRIMFAGEATSSGQSGTVNGAISTGWREAERLIKLYKP